MQNANHMRIFRSRLVEALDWMVLRAPALLQLGPWSCSHCGSVKFFLPPVSRKARDLERDSQTDVQTEEQRPVGNFLHRQALVGQADNRDRFSEKYRSGLARRLFDGQATVSQLAREINVDETDLQLWMRDYMESQQADLIRKFTEAHAADASRSGVGYLECAVDGEDSLVPDSLQQVNGQSSVDSDGNGFVTTVDVRLDAAAAASQPDSRADNSMHRQRKRDDGPVIEGTAVRK